MVGAPEREPQPTAELPVRRPWVRRGGPRRDVDAGWTVEQVAEYVLVSELGEPLGSLADELELVDGVWWFSGDHADWREPLS
ncbi:hypothetical protein [Pimelobacter simplex]|uniref:hypothetical protein n=1 Tax=Nocardioides simplex TaxID=2045 RepID=UPI003AADBE71